jgi:selT/selW/selH-like putative selenoprotein
MVTLVQLAIVGLVLFGARLFEMLKLEQPGWLNYLTTNKFSACMMIWIFGNVVSQNMLSTGAFEISYDGSMIFSKIHSGRMPSAQEIFSGVESILRSR